ncbi:heat shock protein 23-like [Sitodiplosis mosellana]|uniref:heat shock protein 23-like n=1 Tax=Sitodiplosis mosellana TaxID=263140 RepID=UPI002443B96A|nr:heat shock protein 23-like [Sitodiplosis mosellana]
MALYLYNSRYPTRRQFGFHPEDLMVPYERTWDAVSSSFRPFFDEFRNFDVNDVVEKSSKSFVGKDGFQVSLDVQYFQPNEINVRTENNQVVVNAKHEEKRDDHGYISREFTRRYVLPEGFKSEDVTSTLSSDGVLTVKAPRRDPAVEGNVRLVQIQQTGPARLNVTANKDEKTVNEKAVVERTSK